MIVKNFGCSILFYSRWLRTDPDMIVKNFGCSIVFYSILDGWRDPNMIVKNFWYSILFYMVEERSQHDCKELWVFYSILNNFACSILFYSILF